MKTACCGVVLLAANLVQQGSAFVPSCVSGSVQGSSAAECRRSSSSNSGVSACSRAAGPSVSAWKQHQQARRQRGGVVLQMGKGKKGGGGGKGKGGGGVDADGNYDTKSLAKDAEEKMGKSVESMQEKLNSVRTGRANPAILDRVMVDYYGADTPLNQVAAIKTSQATQLVVDPYDKTTLEAIDQALQMAGLGLSPQNDGSVIRLNLPAITEDRRKELVKEAKAFGEDGKVAIRNIRRDFVDSVKKAAKAKELGEDQSLDVQDTLQKLTDKYTKDIDKVIKEKEVDIMKI